MILIICIVMILAVYIAVKSGSGKKRAYKSKRFDIGKYRKKRMKEVEEDDDD
jgi:lipopolysaccharide/colanic/teichoic acid biosynthesis glycosyltransferase